MATLFEIALVVVFILLLPILAILTVAALGELLLYDLQKDFCGRSKRRRYEPM